MIKTAVAYPPSKYKSSSRQKSPPFSSYYGVRFQFVQHCKHVNVILSSRNVRKSRHYAILDAQRIFNGRVKNIHWVHVVVHSVQFFISQDVDMHAGYVHTYHGKHSYVYVSTCNTCVNVDFEFGPANISIGERYRTTLFFG